MKPLLAFAALCCAWLPAQDPFQPFDRDAFKRHLQQAGASEAALAAKSPDEALGLLFPDYAAAAKQADAQDPAAALSLMKILTATQDPYLRAHVRYRLGRVFLDGDDPEQAIKILGEYLAQDRNKTDLDGEALFFYAQALADLPVPLQAAAAFAAFLKHWKDKAPERFVASAQQQLAELESQLESPLHEIADTMKTCERRIKKTDTGKQTQERQEDVLTRLQKLIEEAEEREKAGGGPGGLGNPTSPATKSALPDAGATQIGNLNRPPAVVDRWGSMKQRDREAIETDLQQSIPGHYRKMLDEYYKKLGSGK